MKNFDNKQEQTLVIVKPDGVQRGLIGDVIHRYEQCGLKLVGLKMLIPTKKLTLDHYSIDPDWAIKSGTKTFESYKAKGLPLPGKDPVEFAEGIRRKLMDFMSSGPVVAMIWQGMGAVAVVRKITGSTEPLTSAPGTIRGDYTIDSYTSADADARAVRNIIHASGSVEEAAKEIPIWFDKKEILNYRLVAEEIIYDVNLDGILE
ncbi:MAG TPA: nucleoside-diphosphate kinase [Candidatus Woesebacteria bacterium]|jgi:nucleoside-diphosphate kinase|nr:nucleoside-diphosphate kinase [Candidatus Shapirobacteria bacterium]HOR01702.1 nucleoside-diphosphate kinase [Candidatus Woesebacteria bacterium]